MKKMYIKYSNILISLSFIISPILRVCVTWIYGDSPGQCGRIEGQVYLTTVHICSESL